MLLHIAMSRALVEANSTIYFIRLNKGFYIFNSVFIKFYIASILMMLCHYS